MLWARAHLLGSEAPGDSLRPGLSVDTPLRLEAVSVGREAAGAGASPTSVTSSAAAEQWKWEPMSDKSGSKSITVIIYFDSLLGDHFCCYLKKRVLVKKDCDRDLFRIPGMVLILARTQARSTEIEFFSTLTLHQLQGNNKYVASAQTQITSVGVASMWQLEGCSPDVWLMETRNLTRCNDQCDSPQWTHNCMFRGDLEWLD